MEDKHFGPTPSERDTKLVSKNASKDFINSEIGDSHTGSSTSHHSIQIEAPTTDKSENQSESKNSQPRNGVNFPNRNIAVIDNAIFESINSGLESDIEDNVNDTHASDLPTVKEPDLSIDDNLPETVTLLRTPDGGKCYLVGTAHFSLESQNDVSTIIQAVQPHIVMVELCLSRVHVLQLDENTILEHAKNLNFAKMMDTIKENGVSKGLFYLLLLNMSAHLTKVLGVAPGGEFRRALIEAKKVPNCMVHMGDRPIKITFARALSALSWWQTIRLTTRLLLEREPITQEEVEKFKSRDLIEAMMADLAEKYPPIKEVFVKERDIYLTHSLQLACRPRIGPNGEIIPARVVGVVGIGHSLGIIEHWGKVKRPDIPPIMVIPPPSLSGRILKFTIRASLIGAIVYVGYKCMPVSVRILQTLKSSVEGLAKVSSSR